MSISAQPTASPAMIPFFVRIHSATNPTIILRMKLVFPVGRIAFCVVITVFNARKVIICTMANACKTMNINTSKLKNYLRLYLEVSAEES